MTASPQQPTPVRKEPEAASKLDASCMMRLIQSVQKYLDLMYDCDTSRFDDVFYPSVHLHGFRDGKMVAWSAETYRDILNKRQSPKSINAPREDEILLVDFASMTQALVKVRVRLSAMVFVDHLTWHRINGKWLITSKGFDLESEDDRQR
jgi:putative lumazine-binding protein